MRGGRRSLECAAGIRRGRVRTWPGSGAVDLQDHTEYSYPCTEWEEESSKIVFNISMYVKLVHNFNIQAINELLIIPWLFEGAM